MASEVFNEASLQTSSLCFDRLEFTHRDFDAERFLTRCRAGGHPFERVRDDLRLLLRLVQNSMVELIDREYGRFVDLSTNLAGAHSVVYKLNAEAHSIVGDLRPEAHNVNELIREVDTVELERQQVIDEQEMLRRKIEFFETARRVEALLDEVQKKSQDAATSSLDRLNYYISALNSLYQIYSNDIPRAEAFLQHILSKCQRLLEVSFVSTIKMHFSITSSPALSKTKKNIRSIIASFSTCGRLDSAHACFLNEFLDEELRPSFPTAKKVDESQQGVEFQLLLEKLKTLHEKYESIFEQSAFLNDCILTFMLNFCDDRISNLLFATNVQAFRASYYRLIEFIDFVAGKDCQRSVNPGLVRMVFQKFNTGVYYQLRKQEILADRLESHFKNLDGKCDNSLGFKTNLLCQVWNQQTSIWADDQDDADAVYLPGLVSKCLELSLLILNRCQVFHQQLKEKILDSKSVTLEPVGDRQERKRLLAFLLRFLGDLESLMRKMEADLQLPVALKNQSEIRACVKENVAILNSACMKSVEECIKGYIFERMSSELDRVIEIPRQYRWTRKNAPEKCSAYVEEAFEGPKWLLSQMCDAELNSASKSIRLFVSTALESCAGCFSSKMDSVLSSVSKISSSLSKLKKNSSAAAFGSGGGGGPSDDDEKIRLQLQLDARKFLQLSGELGVEMDATASVFGNVLLQNPIVQPLKPMEERLEDLVPDRNAIVDGIVIS